MQYLHSVKSSISSASQGNSGTSWNQNIQHSVQNSQPLGLSYAKLTTGKTPDTIS
jgi:hypothetical protein